MNFKLDVGSLDRERVGRLLGAAAAAGRWRVAAAAEAELSSSPFAGTFSASCRLASRHGHVRRLILQSFLLHLLIHTTSHTHTE